MPQEIVDEIIDEISTQSIRRVLVGTIAEDDNAVTGALKSCSLVHRTWTYRSQYHLFLRVSLPSWGPSEHDAPRALNRLLGDPAHQHLRHYIRELELYDRPSIKWGLYYRELFPLLRKLTRLRRVHVVNINWTICFPHLRRSFLLSLPPPSELSIGPSCSFQNFAAFLEFIFHFRNVEALHIQSPGYGDRHEYEDVDSPSFRTRVSSALETCAQSDDPYPPPSRIGSLDLIGNNLTPFIFCLAHPHMERYHYLDLSQLHTLSVDPTNYPDVVTTLLPVISAHGTLRHLSLWVDLHDSELPAIPLKTFPSLRRVIISARGARSEMYNAGRWLASSCSGLSPSHRLEELSVRLTGIVPVSDGESESDRLIDWSTWSDFDHVLSSRSTVLDVRLFVYEQLPADQAYVSRVRAGNEREEEEIQAIRKAMPQLDKLGLLRVGGAPRDPSDDQIVKNIYGGPHGLSSSSLESLHWPDWGNRV